MKRRNRSRPIDRASTYQRKFPTIAPAVPLAITPARLSGPAAARSPAIGMITSDGIGGKTVSSKVSRKTPK